jgi:flagellar basal body-associated protein FliL
MEDRDETNKGIELDKIQVPSKTTPSPATPPSAKTESEPEASPRKISTLRTIFLLVSKRKLFVGAVLASLLVGSGVVYLALKDASLDKRESGAYYIGRIVYEIATSVGGEHDVRFTLSVPFRSDAEKNDLMQKLPSINHELYMSGSRADVARSIEQKDLYTLRKHIVNMVHALTGVPTEALDVEALSVE